MFKAKVITVCITLIFVSLPVYSDHENSDDALKCHGKIDDYDVAKSQRIYIDGSWNDDDQLLCNLDGTFDDVTADVCKAWLLSIQDAKSRGAEVQLKYFTEDISSCADLPTWKAIKIAPEYIRVR